MRCDPADWAAARLAAACDPALDLSVVVPARNEAPNVAGLIAEIGRALDAVARFEIIIVDDGSDDETALELNAARAREPRLRVVRHRRPGGQSAAIRSGILAARAPLIATLDGDGQNDPAELPRLLATFTTEASWPPIGLVGGDRSTTRRDRWVKRQASRVANVVRARVLGDRTNDTGCGLKIMRRDAYLLLPYFDHQHRFLAALFLREGFAVRSVPVGHRPRMKGQSKYGVFDRLAVGIVDLLGVAWLRRRRRPVIAIEDS